MIPLYIGSLLNVTNFGVLQPSLQPASSIVADVWQPFEFLTGSGGVNIPALAKSAVGATSATWVVSDASGLLSTSASAEQKTISNPIGFLDTGSFGLACAMSTSVDSVRCVFGQQVDTASVGFWFNGPDLVSDGASTMFDFVDTGSNLRFLVAWRRSGTHFFRFTVGGSLFDITTVNTSSWYWISAYYTRTGSCFAGLYDITGSQVGTTFSASEQSNTKVSEARVGQVSSPLARPGTFLYFDDLVVNTSSAVFPLGP